MNTLFNISHIVLFVLMIAAIIDMASCTIAYAFNRTSSLRLKDIKKGVFLSSVMYLFFNIGYYFLGVVLISKGDLSMTSSELILKIASRMHLASMAFIVAALIVTLVTIYAAVSKEGNISELKKLLGNCIFIAIIFWILAWLIV